MAVRSLLRSVVRMAVRQGTFPSSPGIYGLTNAGLSHGVYGSSPMLDAALSAGFARYRGIHSRVAAHTNGARRLHVLRDVITEHAADGAFAATTVAASSALAGVWYWTKYDTADKSVSLMGGEDPAMKTEGYLRRQQAAAAVKRAMESYHEPIVAEEDDDDDPAMRARFEDWIKKYGRTYKDEDEKARRFRIFKAFARSVDVNNEEAAKSGSTVKYGPTKFADWNTSAC